MQITSILISSIANFENHIANGGDKLLGNVSSIKKRSDEKVYVSGQMQRHVLFSAIERLNDLDTQKGNTFVSNGDGTTTEIEKDLRSDMGGFMIPSKGDYSGRRTSPISVTPAVALEKSKINTDLLIRLKINNDENSNEQSLAYKEFSENDEMLMNFFLDISNLSITKKFTYSEKLNIKKIFVKHANEAERKRRAMLFLNATRFMNDFANQARNAVSGEPTKVLIVFDTIFSRKASKYWASNEQEQKKIIQELVDREAKYFIGNDAGENSVGKAYKEAVEFLKNEQNILYNPTGNDIVVTFKDSFPPQSEENKKTSKQKNKPETKEVEPDIINE